jgi:hypothetical protein
MLLQRSFKFSPMSALLPLLLLLLLLLLLALLQDVHTPEKSAPNVTGVCC